MSGFGRATALKAYVGALGDVDPEGTLYLFNGDSTTEQGGANLYLFDAITNEYRATGGALQRVAGFINFGASGHKLVDWATAAAGAAPVYGAGNLGLGVNDYYGHKVAGGATSLSTQLAWRGANVPAGTKVVWAPCYGINDCILDNTVGNLSQQAITTYVAGYLRTAMRRILTAFPADKIILRVPNPMVARPFNAGAGFPSAAQYPAFGADAPTDQALVEKWNQGIRGGYLAVRNEFPSVRVFDKWELVYGRSDTTKVAAVDLLDMGDLVHPSAIGYQAEAHAFVAFIAPRAKVRNLVGRKAVEESRATVAGLQPWEKYPPYLQDNHRYELVIEGTYDQRGGAFFDIAGSAVAQFFKVARDRPIYVQVGDQAAQYFATYTTTDLAGNGTVIRFGGVALSAAMQAAATKLPVRVYIDPRPKVSTYATMDHVQNARCFMRMPEKLALGGTFKASTGIAVVNAVAIDVYSITANVRTLLGTINIGANGINGTLAAGNPATVAAGTIFEGKLTTVTAANAVVSLEFVPS